MIIERHPEKPKEVVTTADGLLRLQQALEAKSAVLPVVDGSIPPVFLQNSDGSLIYTPV